MDAWTGQNLLGQVLEEGRRVIDRSPEAVSAVTGVAGRTVRRLERGETKARATTLRPLADFYGLDGDFLVHLAEFDQEGGETLRAWLREMAASRFGRDALQFAAEAEDESLWLAMRLARAGTGLSHATRQSSLRAALELRWPALAAEQEVELLEFLEGVMVLDDRRRRLVWELARELHNAQAAEGDENRA